jgi:hypothetical protein
VTAVSAAATSVTRGGPSTLVTVTVHNPGTDAVAVDPPALTFNGSPLGYAAIPDPANPGLIAAGTTTTFSFAVTADLSAPLGATVLDASIHAVTWDSGEEVSDPDATTTDSWTVLGP